MTEIPLLDEQRKLIHELQKAVLFSTTDEMASYATLNYCQALKAAAETLPALDSVVLAQEKKS